MCLIVALGLCLQRERERRPDCCGLGLPLPQGTAVVLSVCVRTQLRSPGPAALLSPSHSSSFYVLLKYTCNFYEHSFSCISTLKT